MKIGNLVLQPLNIQAKLKLAKLAQEQDFQQSVLDTQITIDELYLNLNKDQVKQQSIRKSLSLLNILVFGYSGFS